MRELGQRVDLVHKLRELGGSEELAEDADDRRRVEQVARRDHRLVLHAHAIANDARHLCQANANLVLEQLADAADATVAEMIDIIDIVDIFRLVDLLMRPAVVKSDKVLQGDDEILDGQEAPLLRREFEAKVLAGAQPLEHRSELLKDLVASY